MHWQVEGRKEEGDINPFTVDCRFGLFVFFLQYPGRNNSESQFPLFLDPVALLTWQCHRVVPAAGAVFGSKCSSVVQEVSTGLQITRTLGLV